MTAPTLPLWTPALTEVRKRLLISVDAKKGFGKTTFALGANPPVYYYKFETGDEGVIEPFAASGKEIYTYKVYYNHMNYDEVYNGFLDHLTQTCTYLRSIESTGTIIIDTMSEVYELARFFHFGGRQNQVDRAYAPVYVDMKEIIRMVEGAGVNGIFVHQLGDSRDDKVQMADGSIVPATYVKGWSGINYEMPVIIDTFQEIQEVFAISTEGNNLPASPESLEYKITKRNRSVDSHPLEMLEEVFVIS